jgi:hypothetical protein
MRGTSKTTDELISFWNERCAPFVLDAILTGLTHFRAIIEEEYAHRLAKLAKLPIGSDEIG